MALHAVVETPAGSRFGGEMREDFVWSRGDEGHGLRCVIGRWVVDVGYVDQVVGLDEGAAGVWVGLGETWWVGWAVVNVAEGAPSVGGGGVAVAV